MTYMELAVAGHLVLFTLVLTHKERCMFEWHTCTSTSSAVVHSRLQLHCVHVGFIASTVTFDIPTIIQVFALI